MKWFESNPEAMASIRATVRAGRGYSDRTTAPVAPRVRIRINAVDPGYTATDFNGHSGPQTVTEGTDVIVTMASIGADGPTGTFSDRHGTVHW